MVENAFADHFSGHAKAYAAARPDYPAALFKKIAQTAPATGTVWDCACGNGQAAVGLAGHFDQVFATDGSETQIAQARQHPAVHYTAATAEHSGLPDHCADAITVAQALHWFDLDAFLDEARRVLKPNGILVVWSYGLTRISTKIDTLIDHLYEDITGPYWPPERRIVERGYQDIALPNAQYWTGWQMQQHWNADQLLAYLASWSGCQRYQSATQRDPLAHVAEPIRKMWSDDLKVTWPLTVICARF